MVSSHVDDDELRAVLRERWIFVAGDSTSRVLFNALLDALGRAARIDAV
jgi:hypothetical protein